MRPKYLVCRLAAVSLIALLAASCVESNGRSLPEGRLAFPVAAATAGADTPEFLFVANSNFDLFYNSGSVQSYNLEALNDALDNFCGSADDPEFCALIPPSRFALGPEVCDVSPPRVDVSVLRSQGLREDVDVFCVNDLLVSEVRTGSFADGIAVSPTGKRLYLPIRSDGSLSYIDVDAEGRLSCGGDPETFHTCTSAFRNSDRTIASSRDIKLPSDPVAVAAGDLAVDFGPPLMGDYIIVAHRDGEASLFVDENVAMGSQPKFVFAVDELGSELVTVEIEPGSKIAWAPSARSERVARIGIAVSDTSADPIPQAFLFDAGPRLLTGIDTGIDTRDIQFDPRPGRHLAYILSRTPEELVIASTAQRIGLPERELDILQTVPVAAGPSRVQLATFDVGETEPKLLAFVASFNARVIQVIDADLGVTVTSLTGVSGAFELQVDVPRERLYVTDFRTSVIRIIDLRPTLDCLSGVAPSDAGCTPAPLGLVGIPEAIEELR